MSLRGQTEKGSTASGTSHASFLIVVCSGAHLAIPADVIRGIMKPDDDKMAEALEVLGVQHEVTDLSARFELSNSVLSPDTRVVVCGIREGRHAFRVSAVVGLQEIEASKIVPLLPHFSGAERQWFSGMFLFRESVALVVEPGWMLGEHTLEPQRAVGRDHQTGAFTEPASILLDTGHGLTDPGPIDVMELEEATDADDIPWAQF